MAIYDITEVFMLRCAMLLSPRERAADSFVAATTFCSMPDFARESVHGYAYVIRLLRRAPLRARRRCYASLRGGSRADGALLAELPDECARVTMNGIG